MIILTRISPLAVNAFSDPCSLLLQLLVKSSLKNMPLCLFKRWLWEIVRWPWSFTYKPGQMYTLRRPGPQIENHAVPMRRRYKLRIRTKLKRLLPMTKVKQGTTDPVLSEVSAEITNPQRKEATQLDSITAGSKAANQTSPEELARPNASLGADNCFHRALKITLGPQSVEQRLKKPQGRRKQWRRQTRSRL